MPKCLIPNCPNEAVNNLSIRCRRPDTSAIWAPNCNAYLCDDHADNGYTIDISLVPNVKRCITTKVTAGGFTKIRTTPITHRSVE